MNAISQPAYVLHTRPYRNTSAIVDFFTPDYGRVTGVVKSVYGRGKATQQLRGLLQGLQCLQIQWVGKRELKTVISVEASGGPVLLAGTSLYCAMYINELLMRLLHAHDAHESLFSAYESCLLGLQRAVEMENCLRDFEFFLLSDLGYGIDFFSDSDGAQVEPERHYRFQSAVGFIPLSDDNEQWDAYRDFSGAELLAVARQNYSDPAIRQVAKRLTRLALKPLLGDKPLESRNLFRSISGTTR